MELLTEWRTFGVRVKINDEGEYWPRRSIESLRRNLENMNGLVAAAAGALKDADESDGPGGVQSPIFAHPQFERLEAEGTVSHGDSVRKLRNVVSRTKRER